MFFVHRCQFRLSALLYFKKNPSVMMKRRKDLFKKKKKSFSLKSQFLHSSKFNVWLVLYKATSVNVFCNFFTEIRQLPLLEVGLRTLSIWTCRFPIICMQSWYTKGKQMLVTTGPTYMISLEKAGSNTMTSPWQNHHGKNWREIHLAARRMLVPTAWCT